MSTRNLFIELASVIETAPVVTPDMASVAGKVLAHAGEKWKAGSFKRQFGKTHPKTARLMAVLARARDGKPAKQAKAKPAMETVLTLSPSELALLTAFRAAK